MSANSTNPLLRWGLIGYGAWGSHHARAITSTSGNQLSAIATRSAESRQRAALDHPQAKLYADVHELLAHESLDVVDVVLPSDLHFEVARAVLESGRHLLLEKPMCLGVEHCDQLNQLARSRGLQLAVGHELRHSALWGRVKQMVDRGDVGAPLHVLIELWRRPYRLGSQGWRYDIRRVGNWILEEPIHFFDLARWYLARVGEPHTVYATGNGRQPGHPELHDNFSAMLHFPQGCYAVVTQTLAGWEHHQSVKLTGTEGALWARWSGALDRTFQPSHSLHWQRGGGEPVEVPIEQPSGEVYELVDEVAQFSRALRAGLAPSCTGDDGRAAVAMCLAAQESLETQRHVQLPGAPA